MLKQKNNCKYRNYKMEHKGQKTIPKLKPGQKGPNELMLEQLF